MEQKGVLSIGAIIVAGLVVACGGNDKPTSPASPTSSVAADANAAADGSTLKVNPPALVSPVGGARLTTAQVTLTFGAATGKYVQGGSYTYRVQLLNAGSALLEEKTGTALSYTMATKFDPDTLYRWRVRAELQGRIGPWSATETFKSMEKPAGYIRGNEIYDTLDDGKTVGSIAGPATFIPGVGLRLDSNNSWIEYTLPQTLTAGEFSLLVTNLNSDGDEGTKSKVIAMKEDGADITTNEYRFTLEKRGNGTVAWRMIVGNDDQIETVGNGGVPPTRQTLMFHEDTTYFFKVTWGGALNIQIRQNGIDGSLFYQMGDSYHGIYQPTPHKIYVGCSYSPRSGPQSVAGMIARQVWVSPNPRPSWAK